MTFRLLLMLLRIQELPRRAQSLIQKLIIIAVIIQFSFFLSNTFYVLFVIDTVGLGHLGILIAVSFLIQAVLDYPSGVIGDWIGQKWILFIAYASYGLAYGVLFFADSFSTLLIVYILQAFAASQQSGALQAWFDNNYKVAADEADPERKTYRFVIGRWGMFTNFTGAIAFVIGGLLATIYFRQIVFAIQAIAMFLLAIGLLFSIKDFPEVVRSERSIKNYFGLMGEGLRFVFLNKMVLLFVIGLCINAAIWTIWGNMILLPLYFGYTGSDGGASLLRFIIWVIGVPIAALAANLGSKLGIEWLPRLQFLHTLCFFSSFMLLFTWFPIYILEQPITGTFEPIAIILTIIILTFTPLIFYTANIIQQRIFFDLVPDQNRNSVYSLIPTLVLIINAPSALIGGQFLDIFGLTSTLFFLAFLGVLYPMFFYISIRLIPPKVLDQTVEDGT
ncbi:MAG: MFS transporter [Candidatus Hodarchaeota archaeon]